MSERIQLGDALPTAYKNLLTLHKTVENAAADAGIDTKLIELVKIRASQLNGCASCIDMHARDARAAGETERRIFLLSAWWETELYSEQERAALALTDAMTKLSDSQDVPDEVYTQATAAFTEQEYAVVAWAATVINAFNRINVTSHKPVPAE